MKVLNFIDALNLKVLAKGPDDTEIEVANSIRCGMQLSGFYGYFFEKRIQIIGNAEVALLETFEKDNSIKSVITLLEKAVPCIVLTSGATLSDDIITYAKTHNKWLLATDEPTSKFIIDTTLFLQNQLAESIMIHGVLLDIFGMGVLIKGDSGVGKSITAIELVRRGHLFIADDVVIIKKISSQLLIGKPDSLTKNLMECRGVGIININSLFGKSAIRQQATIDLIIHLEKWDESNKFSGIGDEIETTSLMGVELPVIKIPVHPGQTISTSIIEIGALNLRQNQMGYNTAKELIKSTKALTQKSIHQ